MASLTVDRRRVLLLVVAVAFTLLGTVGFVVFHYDDDRPGFADPVALEYRVSNSFALWGNRISTR